MTRPAIEVEITELAEDEIETLDRPQMPLLPPAERLADFREVRLGFTAEMAIAEARRCLRCDTDVQQVEKRAQETAVAG